VCVCVCVCVRVRACIPRCMHVCVCVILFMTTSSYIATYINNFVLFNFLLCSEEQSVVGGHNAIVLMKKRLPDYG